MLEAEVEPHHAESNSLVGEQTISGYAVGLVLYHGVQSKYDKNK
jgi:hypothetical protein